jgi:hypothetical protein
VLPTTMIPRASRTEAVSLLREYMAMGAPTHAPLSLKWGTCTSQLHHVVRPRLTYKARKEAMALHSMGSVSLRLL